MTSDAIHSLTPGPGNGIASHALRLSDRPTACPVPTGSTPTLWLSCVTSCHVTQGAPDP